MTAPALAPPAVALIEAAGGRLHYMPAYPPQEAVARLVRDVQADAVLSRQGAVTREAIAASARLRIVARHGVGVDDVDLAAAAERGVLVTRATGSNTQAVAEHAIAMLLALAKGLHVWPARLAGGAWRDPAAGVRDVAGLRLAVLGLGPIGREVARLAIVLGCTVTAFDPDPAASPDLAAAGIARAPSAAAAAEQADALSVHCPLLPATRNAVDAALLARLRPGGFVINTARGGIVDEAALLAALDGGHLGGAALDVFAQEPLPAGAALRTHPLVIATPHLAGVTTGSLVRMGVMAAECIVAALTGGSVPADRIVRL